MFGKLDRLIAKEIISLTFVFTTSVSSLMIMARVPKYVDFLFSTSDVFTSFLMLLLYSLPSILKYTLPISLLLGSAVAVMRMSSDRELEAWLSCGVSVFRLALIPSVLGIFATFVSMGSALFLEPYSTKQFDKFRWLKTRMVVEAFVQKSLKEGSFIDNISFSNSSELTFYFNKLDSSKTNMEDVFMALGDSNRSSYSSIIVAKRGQLSRDAIHGYPDFLFKLSQGFIYTFEPSKPSFSKKVMHQDYPYPVDWKVTSFSDLNISLVSLFKDKFKLENSPHTQWEELYPMALKQALQAEKEKTPHWRYDESYIDKLMFFIKQFSIPLATLFLPAIGVCLGVIDPRRKQISVYLGIGIVIFFLYSSLSITQNLAHKFLISPYSLLWVTPLILSFILGLLFRWRVYYPPSVNFFEFLVSEFRVLRFPDLFRKIFSWS